LEKNPLKGGRPAIASQPSSEVAKVIGMTLRSPPIFHGLVSSAIACMTEPAARKSSALKKPWVSRWKTPATCAPSPTPMNM